MLDDEGRSWSMEDWGLKYINSKVDRLERVCAYIFAYKLDQPSLLETFFHASRLFQLCNSAPSYDFLKHSQCSTPPSWKHTSSIRLRQIEQRQSFAWPVRFHELPSSELTLTLHTGKACRADCHPKQWIHKDMDLSTIVASSTIPPLIRILEKSTFQR